MKSDIMKKGIWYQIDFTPVEETGFFKKISRLLELTRWGYG
jgi:hypothetical protein